MTKLTIVLLSFISASVFAYNSGISSFPLKTKDKLVSAEFGGFMSEGKGVGVQARYTQKINPLLTVDGGFGFSDGERAHRFFASADYEFFPDYMKQPRISMKGMFLRGKEFERTVTRLSMAPTVSKGFNFWGKEAFPFISLPLSMELDAENNKYQIISQVSFGASSQVPFEGFEKVLANLETTININNGFSAVFLGMSYPLN